MNTNTKFIGVTGMGEADFLIYLSELLVESGKQVAVIDDSPEKDIFALLPFQETVQEIDNIFTYHGVEYRKIFREEEEIHDSSYMDDRFDVVFLVTGTGIEEVIWDYPVEAWYVFLTANRKGIERTIDAFQDFQTQDAPVFLFIRDFCDYKITAAYIRGLWREARGNIAGWYEIPFDMIDYEYFIRMQYEPVNEYKQLSKEIKEVLITVASKLTGFTKKEEEMIYKKLKRGRKRCR